MKEWTLLDEIVHENFLLPRKTLLIKLDTPVKALEIFKKLKSLCDRTRTALCQNKIKLCLQTDSAITRQKTCEREIYEKN